MTFKFTVYGAPVPKERPRLIPARGNRRPMVITPKRTLDYEALVAASALEAGVTAFEGNVHLSVVFYLPSHRRADGDNLIKSVMDGLNGIAYADDSQVTCGTFRKCVDKDHPRAVIAMRIDHAPELKEKLDESDNKGAQSKAV